ncbi:MAG: 1,4-dihydroxy-6-naphthoate synthase [Thermodesulfovibrio sp.]|nr:1,4-dihydroxy-6-naphthoate synthase [Thermodesulfovibrio sp.]
MLNFGISPCPNDTFIFYGMIKERIDLKGYKFNFIIEDVETLNNLCIKGVLPISKVSVHAFYYLQRDYDFLNSGGAISELGPVVVTKDIEQIKRMSEIKIALPGKLTTASALMWFYWRKNFSNKRYSLKFVPFNQIIDELLNEKVHLGVLIHEGRFIYQHYDFNLIADLGEFWKKETGMPIPLGCVIVKKNNKINKKILDNIIRESILYSKKNMAEVLPFIKNYAQELKEEVIISHIHAYVNDFSLNLTNKGKQSIITFLKKLQREGIWN